MACLAVTGCAQLTGPPKAEYVDEDCETHYRWDTDLQMNRITHQVCTKSYVKSNRVFQDGLKIDANRETGKLKVEAGTVDNAAESSIAKALAALLSEPAGIDAILSILRSKQ
jgi:hypothetical protein